jgi:HD superfamily phosphodiesterase
MLIQNILERMIVYSEGNLHDIDHFIRVWAYAKLIGELEKLNSETQFILESAAITHDIACPLCRKKYGNSNGKLQEKEGEILVREFFSDSELTARQIDRIAFLVAHHHTLANIDSKDWQILVEADYIANALENGYNKNNIQNFIEKIARTESGKKIIREVFHL